jgi:DNA-binding NtrC family response regulator
MVEYAHILVVDDDPYDKDRYCDILRSCGYSVESALSVDEAIQIIEKNNFDVVLLDMLLPWNTHGRFDFGGIELLRRIKARDADTQVIVVTGYGSRELAAEAMNAGAFDFITKDPDADDRLPGSARVAAVSAQRRRALTKKSGNSAINVSPTIPSNLIADSAAMRLTLRRALRLAEINAPLLIVGEAGVGKELLASVVHLNSRHSTGPFVVVSCRTLSSNFIELWGDVNKPGSGFCAQAEGGTLLLKGIQDLSLDQQKNLVTLLKGRHYRPVGAIQDTQCNLRVIATATADLERLVRQERFWPGLYEELSIAMLNIPPLRERRDKDDIIAIAGYLLHHYGLAKGISPEAAKLIATYDYMQGNVRELEQILRGAAVQASGHLIEPNHLPTEMLSLKITGIITIPPQMSDGLILSVRFVPGTPIVLIWDSYFSGSTRSSLKLPFSEADIPLLLRALDAVQWPSHPHEGPKFSTEEQTKLAQLSYWEGNQVVPDIDRRIGALLYQAVTADPSARSALDTARNISLDRGQPLTFVLRFPSDAAAIAALPWELLWDERQPVLLSRAKLSSLIRYVDLPQAIPPTPSLNKNLRLLAVCPGAGIPESLHMEEEKQRKTAFKSLIEAGLISIEECHPAYISDLTDRLQDDSHPIDILHFYGHGVWRQGTAYLTFDDGELSGSQFAALVGDIPLVVLHACRSGMISTDDLFTGIAPVLSAEGVGAVVAMQFTVSVKAANRFSAVLYRNLAEGETLQIAVAKARQALYVEHRQSWYVPVVYIRSRDIKPVVLVRK